MKKSLFFVLLSAALPAIWVPVAAQDAPLVPVQNLAPVPANAAPFEWRLRLKTGQKFLATTDTSTQSFQQIPTMPGAKTDAPVEIENLMKMHMVIEQNVLSSDEKGARVEMIYREMSQQTRTMQGEKVIYDSTNPPAGMEGMGDMTKGLIGAKISYLLSPTGEISDVLGAEAYIDKLLAGMEEAMKNAPGAAEFRKTMRASMKGMLSPEAIKSSFGSAYRAMPTTPIALGGTWKTMSALPMMGTSFNQNNQNTFVSRQDGLVTLAQKGEFATDAGAEFKVPFATPRDPKTPAPVTQMDMHGDLSGETVVDEQSGMMMSSTLTQTMEGEMVMSGLTGKGSTLSIPMKMKTEIVATTREIKAEIKPEIKAAP